MPMSNSKIVYFKISINQAKSQKWIVQFQIMAMSSIAIMSYSFIKATSYNRECSCLNGQILNKYGLYIAKCRGCDGLFKDTFRLMMKI